MNIIALVKRVSDSEARVHVKADGSALEVEDKYTLNFFDSMAVEEALRIKEQRGTGTVTVITLGTQKSIEVLRTGLAMGADKAILLQDKAFEGGDAYATARVLAQAIKGMEYDLILCGKESFDGSSGAVGPLVAEFLGIPHVTVVVKVEVSPDERTVVMEREIEGGKEIIKSPFPLLISTQKGLNEPRVPPITGVMKAMRAEVTTLNMAAIGLAPDEVGRAGSREEIVRYYTPPGRPPVKILKGNADAAVKELIKLLKVDVKVI